jgi:hypothetical protein
MRGYFHHSGVISKPRKYIFRKGQYIFYTFLFLFFYSLCFCQRAKIDSLKNVLSHSRDTARINCLNELGQCYCNYDFSIQYYARTDSAELCVNEAYSEAVALNYQLGIGEAFLNLGEIYLRRWNFDVGRKNVGKAISVFKIINAQTELFRAYSVLEDAFLSEDDYTSAITYAKMLLGYYQKSKDPVGEAQAWDDLRECYSWQGNYEKAFEYSQNQFNILKSRSDPSSVLTMLRNKKGLYQLIEWDDSVAVYSAKIDAYEKKIGMLHPSEGSEYFWTGKFDSAELYNKKFRNFLVSNNGYDSIIKERTILRSDIDLASVYQFEGRYKEALPMFMKALQYDKERNVAFEEDEELMNITMIYDLERKFTDAIHYGKALISLAIKTKSSYYRQRAYQELWDIYNNQKDSANAYKYYIKYTALRDSTITQTFQRKLLIINDLNNEKQQQQQIATLDKNNKLKQATIERNVLIRNVLLASVLLLILLAFIIYRIFALKRRNEKHLRELAENDLQIQKLESEKKETELKHQASELELQALRAQMNPHFIFNCLNSINRFIINNNESKAADYLTKFAKLIRIVLEQSGKSFVPLADELKCLQLYMDLEALRFEIPFHYEINCNETDTSSVMIPTLLIQPFVENAIWHGLEANGNCKGKININIHVQDKLLHCKICDNGVGRTATAIKQKTDTIKNSLGIHITQHRLQLIDVSKRHESGIEIHDILNEDGCSSGTCVNIKIPMKEL